MTTSIRLAPEIERRLDYLASQTGRTKAYYLRGIIEHGIERWKTTILLLTWWNVSARTRNRCIHRLT